jgi:N-acetylglutamate synthase-like GNAT family acetyltransferase
MDTILIIPYREEYKSQVLDLILEIQQEEFLINITRNDQPDLENVESFYQKNNGNFWVCILHNQVIGTIALLDIGNDIGALRKMFVKKTYRGKEYGIGQLLLNTLLLWANEKNIKRIVLGTTEKFVAAQKFYEKNNFVEINKNSLPSKFPIMAVDVKFYELVL